jgi:hypothetical protein
MYIEGNSSINSEQENLENKNKNSSNILGQAKIKTNEQRIC